MTLLASRRAALAGLGLLALSACDRKAGAKSGKATIVVGAGASVSNVSLYLANARGYFAQNGLTVTPRTVASGAQAFPMLLNGQLAITASDPLTVLKAAGRGLPLLIIAQGSAGRPTVDTDPTGLIVKADAPIKTGADFAGKTIAVNALGSISQVSAQAAIDALGGDSKMVKFIEMPVPTMTAAVERGQVDGAVTSEPFVTDAKQAGLRVAIYPPSQGTPDVPQLLYVTTRAYAEANPEIIAHFVAGMDHANADLARDPQLIREVAAHSTKISAQTLKTMRVPVFSTKPLDVTTLRNLEGYMLRYGVIAKPIGVDGYVL